VIGGLESPERNSYEGAVHEPVGDPHVLPEDDSGPHWAQVERVDGLHDAEPAPRIPLKRRAPFPQHGNFVVRVADERIAGSGEILTLISHKTANKVESGLRA